MEVTRMQSDYPASALARLAELLESSKARWVVGGSTGLVLRGAQLDQAPRDLDIYTDSDNVLHIHKCLREFVMDEPAPSETERYRSILSHYQLSNTTVELVGGFRVTALHSVYTTEVNEVLFPNCDKVEIEGHRVPLVPLGHELIFNILRERKDRARVAGQLISKERVKHMPLLLMLLQRNQLAASVVEEALLLAQASHEQQPWVCQEDTL